MDRLPLSKCQLMQQEYEYSNSLHLCPGQTACVRIGNVEIKTLFFLDLKDENSS